MKIELDFNDRQYNDIELYCKSNKLDIQAYLIDIITEKHSINKFGDLNDIIPKAIEESTVSVKKRGRPRKNTEEKKEENTTVETPIKEDIKKEKDILEDKEIEQTVVKPTIKRKRTLKTL